MNWTQEQRDELMLLWDGGRRTFGELARHFKVTRSSIAGRIRREKKLRGIPSDPAYAHRKPRAYSPTDKKPSMRKDAMLTLPGRAEFVISAFKAPAMTKPDEGQLASIIDVTGCKWPVKDDPAYVGGVAFCNHHADEGQSYCPYHRAESVASYSRTLISKTVRSAWHVYNKRAA